MAQVASARRRDAHSQQLLRRLLRRLWALPSVLIWRTWGPMRALGGMPPWLKPALRTCTLHVCGLAGGVVAMGWLCSCAM